MAITWIENQEVINDYHGITLYHLYQNDDFDCGEREFYFTTESSGSELDDEAFDVREQKGYDPEKTVAQNLVAMIDSGCFGEPQMGAANYSTTESRKAHCPVCGHKISYTGKKTVSFVKTENGTERIVNREFTCPECGCCGNERNKASFCGYKFI